MEVELVWLGPINEQVVELAAVVPFMPDRFTGVRMPMSRWRCMSSACRYQIASICKRTSHPCDICIQFKAKSDIYIRTYRYMTDNRKVRWHNAPAGQYLFWAASTGKYGRG